MTVTNTDPIYTCNYADAIISKFDMFISSIHKNDMELEILGTDSSFINSLRRIMVAEVPSMAIERVFVISNTSVIQDEVLAHRLGLIPICADPTQFRTHQPRASSNEKNTIVLFLSTSCTTTSLQRKAVLSGTIEWLPSGSNIPNETNCKFFSSQKDIRPPIRPASNNILLAILAPGQEIVIEAHCFKGVGKEHAKWSPVSTCWYRCLYEVSITQEIKGCLAEHLVQELPGLFHLESKQHSRRIVLGETRIYDFLLEKLRRISAESTWDPYLKLRRIMDHFILKIEASGALTPWMIFEQALNILIAKIDHITKTIGDNAGTIKTATSDSFAHHR
jgi:DNA-directed RNA polymerase I and III subunit RPAC1